VGGLTVQELPEHTLLANARRPDGEEIVAVPPNRDAEVQRFNGLILTDELLVTLSAARRLEG
jgi:hypothetical protein